MAIHENATFKTGDLLPNGEVNLGLPQANTRIVMKDPYDHRDIVYDRWLPLLSKGTIVSSGQQYTMEEWHYYVVHPNQKTITEQMYFTSLDLKEHGPISNGVSIERSGLRDGIDKFQCLMGLRLPSLKEVGFKAKNFGKHKNRYVTSQHKQATKHARCVPGNGA